VAKTAVRSSGRKRGALVTPLKRTAIVVRDLPRSLEFYQGVLGMSIWAQGSAGAELPAMHQLLGMPPCDTRWVVLQSNDVDFGMVGLFELTNPAPADDTHPSIDRANRGEACLVFHTHDVDRVYEESRAMGLTVLCPPTRLEIAELGVVSSEMTLRDPNGVLCNFIQNLVPGKLALANRFPWVRRKSASKVKSRPRRKAKLAPPPAKKKRRSAAKRARR
jgi:catechol 2,3-dioxygenase-like lactoylglutathione lyase family enzyme